MFDDWNTLGLRMLRKIQEDTTLIAKKRHISMIKESCQKDFRVRKLNYQKGRESSSPPV